MDTDFYLRPLLALFLVIGMIFMAGAVVRRISPIRSWAGKRSAPSLEITERLNLDARRQLVLVRHNDREHLILLGNTSELLIDAGQAAPSFTTTEQEAAQDTICAAPLLPEPEPERVR